MSFVFDKLSPPPLLNKHFKIGFKSFLVYSSAKDSLRSAKNMVFFLFSILVGRPIIGGAIAPRSPPPLPTRLALLRFNRAKRVKSL